MILRKLLMSPPSGTFLPTDLPAVKAWWNPRDATKLTLAGATVNAFADSITGLSLAKNGSPTYSATSINGVPAIGYGGSSSLSGTVTPTGLTLGTSETWSVYLCKKTANPGTGTQQSHIAVGWSGGVYPRLDFVADTGAMSVQGGVSGALGIGASSTYDLIVAGYCTNGTDIVARLNGTPVVGTGTSGITAGAGVNIGSESPGVNAFNGAIGDVIFATTLSTDSIQMLEGYIAWQYGIPTILPATHPYRYDAP